MNGGFIGTFTDISIYQCLSFPRAFEVFSESYLSNILRRLDPDLVELWVGIILEHSELDPKASLNRDSLPSIHKLRFSPVCFLRAYRNIFRVHVPIEVEHPFSSMALAWTWTCMSAAFRLAGSLTNTNWFFEVSDRLRYFDQLIVHVIDLNLILQQIPNYLPMAMEILVFFFESILVCSGLVLLILCEESE